MDQAEANLEQRNLLDRLARFLEMFTSGLLSSEEQADMLDIFGPLSSQCQGAADQAARWESPISVDGVPFEFSVAVDRSDSISVRFVADTQRRPSHPEDSKATMRRNADLVVPCKQQCADLLDSLFDRYFAHTTRMNTPLVLHGIRVAHGKGRAGRLYFRTWDRPQEEVRDMLAQFMRPDDLKALRSPCVTHLRVAGVAYDFDAHGLARIKVYFWTQGSAREVGLAAAREFLGEACGSLEELLDIVSRRRHPLRAVPRIFLGFGFRPQGGYRDVKLSLPVCEWGRMSFRQIMPQVSEALSRWNIDIDRPRRDPTFQPVWRFLPSWLSADRSPRGESLSVYFVPAGDPTGLCPAEAVRGTPWPEAALAAAQPRSKADRSAILQRMFDLMLNSDARDETPG